MNALKKILVLVVVLATFGTGTQAFAATGTIGTFRAGKTGCGTFPGRHIEVGDPAMFAVNATSGTDYQWVAYKPVVYRWNGSSWAYYATDGWMRGRATDSSRPSRWIDEGGQAHISPIAMGINVAAGHYKVAVRYYWYQTANVGSGSDFRWVPRYDNQDGSVTTNYCTVR